MRKQNSFEEVIIKRHLYFPSTVGLTLAALEKHNEIIEDFDDLAVSETTGVSSKSKAFSISGLTDCSNMTFNKVLDRWNSPDALDREVGSRNYLINLADH